MQDLTQTPFPAQTRLIKQSFPQSTSLRPNPYRVYSDFLIDRYGDRTYKLSIAGGRTCPTRDGAFGPKKGWGGCSFCDVYGSASFFANLYKEHSDREQLELAEEGVVRRYKAKKFIAYFQSYSTTYDEVDDNLKRYEAAAEYPGVVCLALGTRPDCIPSQVLKKYSQLAKQIDIQFELGVQSFNDLTLEWMDRGHDSACSVNAIERIEQFAKPFRARGRHIDCVVHLIFGSPQETETDLIRTAKLLNELGVRAVKIHQLFIIKKTKLASRYKRGEFEVSSLEQHVLNVATFLRYLHPDTVIHRIHATASHPEDLIAPQWSVQKCNPVEKLRHFMNEFNWQQGDLYV